MTTVHAAEFASPAATTSPAEAIIPPTSLAFRRYAVGLLLVIFILNFFDRQVINVLAEQIRHELHLADWQIGMMTGFAFAVFNALFGLPIAHLADRYNRPFLLGGAVAVWSAFTALCGLAQTFGQLLIGRLGVGGGEAGCTPLAQSLICDYVPREKRASALSLYHMGVPLGSLLGLAVGGILSDAFGWRNAFLIAGAPGLLFAVLAAATLREPRRALTAHFRASTADRPGFRETLKYLAKKRSFLLGVMFVATAQTQDMATLIAKTCNPLFFHFPLEPGIEMPSYAYPFTPAEIERGQVFEFRLCHVVETADGFELVRSRVFDLTQAEALENA